MILTLIILFKWNEIEAAGFTLDREYSAEDTHFLQYSYKLVEMDEDFQSIVTEFPPANNFWEVVNGAKGYFAE